MNDITLAPTVSVPPEGPCGLCCEEYHELCYFLHANIMKASGSELCMKVSGSELCIVSNVNSAAIFGRKLFLITRTSIALQNYFYSRNVGGPSPRMN